MLFNCTTILIALFVSFLAALYAYFKWSFGYWSRKGVQTPTPSIPFGNAAPLLLGQKRFDHFFWDIYNDLRAKNLKFGGMYFITGKTFIPLDLELMKNILVKDFNHFVNHGLYLNEEDDPLTGNVLTLEDEEWKSLRHKLTPTFTSGKMKMMFHLINDCAVGLEKLIKKNIAGGQALDIRETVICYTTDVIGSCAFGSNFKTMQNPNNDFRKFGRIATEPPFIDMLKSLMSLFFSRGILKRFKLRINNTEMTNFFMKVIHDTVQYREENNDQRKDLLQLLIDLKNSGNEVALSNNRLAAQAFIFYIGGFETSATTISFALLELALNPTIQLKVRKEIQAILAKNNEEITYESLMEMKYLDQIISETLRMYPPFGSTIRSCNKDYQIPGTNVTIEKGTTVIIPILGLHYNHEYYPNPTLFDPDRFNEETKASRPNFTWLPFGEGPRICLGMRFAMMQTKMAMIKVLNNYEVTVNRKTKIPLQYEVNSTTTSVKGGIWLDLHEPK